MAAPSAPLARILAWIALLALAVGLAGSPDSDRIANAEPAPDLTATKTNDTGGTALVGLPFTWTITVSNEGDAEARFFDGWDVLYDELPGAPDYTLLTTTASTASGARVACLLSSNNLLCEADPVNPSDDRWIHILPGESLTVELEVVPDGTDTLENPRRNNQCQANFQQISAGRDIGEVDLSDNFCSDSVTVSNEPPPTTHTVYLCKALLDNGDGDDDSGSFGFSGDFDGSIAGGEGDTVDTANAAADDQCTSLGEFDEGSQVSVTEDSFPNGWTSHTGYPQVTFPVTNGSTVEDSEATATITSLGGETVILFTNRSVPTPVPTHAVYLCKALLDNGDGDDDSGSFGFSGDFDGSIAAGEGASVDTANAAADDQCTSLGEFDEGSQVSVTEDSFPGDWVNDSGYPQVTFPVTNGSAVEDSGATATITSLQGETVILFTNRSEPTPVPTHAVYLCKALLDNDDGDDDSGSFGFSGGFGGGFAAGEGDTVDTANAAADDQCTSLGEFDEGSQVTVTEDGFPGGWTSDTGYPQVTFPVTNGSAVEESGATATITSLQGETVILFTNRSAPTPVPTHTVYLCKALLDNGDGDDDSGSFGFSGGFDGSIAAGEGDAVDTANAAADDQCTSLGEFDEGSQVSVTEDSFPNGWTSDTGYPQVSFPVTNGSAVEDSGATATITSLQGETVILFTNRSAPTPAVHQVRACKMVEDNGDSVAQSGSFAFTGDVVANVGVVVEGQSVCSEYAEVVGDAATVAEVAPGPAWQTASWSADNLAGSSGSGGTATIVLARADGAVTITYSNTHIAQVRAGICKAVVSNEVAPSNEGNVFDVDVLATRGGVPVEESLTLTATEDGVPDCIERVIDAGTVVVLGEDPPSGWAALGASETSEPPAIPNLPLESMTLAADGTMLTVFNRAGTRAFTIGKNVLDDGDLEPGEAHRFGFDVAFELPYAPGSAVLPGVASLTVAEGGSEFATILIPSAATDVVVTEHSPGTWDGDAVGYPTRELTDDSVDFLNQELTRTVTVGKIVTVGDSDPPAEFPISIDNENIDPVDLGTLASGETVNEAIGNEQHTVTETLPSAEWQALGWLVLPVGDGEPVCPTEIGTELGTGTTATVPADGDDYIVCFYNQRLARVVVTKQDLTAGQTWTFSSNIPAADAFETTGSGSTGTIFVVPGNYFVSEDQAQPQSVCTGSTATHFTIALVNGVNDPDLVANFAAAGGTTTNVTFVNIPCDLDPAIITVIKVEDLDGDGVEDAGEDRLPGWEITLDGNGSQVVQFTGASGETVFIITDIDSDTDYTVSEATQAGYTPVGATSVGVTVGPGDAETVIFYNQPAGNLIVEKVTTLNGQPDPANDAGWEIRVTSADCGIDETLSTNVNGVADFGSLPACDDYVVSEDVSSGPSVPGGWTVVQGPVASGVAVVLGDTTTVTFVNNRTETPPTGTPTEPPSGTPTETPSETPTPPETPTEPPETPTDEPTDEPTDAPTEPTDEPTIIGEETVTPEPTDDGTVSSEPVNPTPPASGTGLAPVDEGSTSQGLLMVLGLVVLTGGIGLVAISRRRRTA